MDRYLEKYVDRQIEEGDRGRDLGSWDMWRTQKKEEIQIQKVFRFGGEHSHLDGGWRTVPEWYKPLNKKQQHVNSTYGNIQHCK